MPDKEENAPSAIEAPVDCRKMPDHYQYPSKSRLGLFNETLSRNTWQDGKIPRS
jgi:hypothetical protein